MFHAHSQLAPLTARWRAYAWMRRAARGGIALTISIVAFTFATLERVLAGARRAFDWLLWRLGYARVVFTYDPRRDGARAAPRVPQHAYPGAPPPPAPPATAAGRVPRRPIPTPPPLPEPEPTRDFEDEAPTTLYLETSSVEGTVVDAPWTLNAAKTRVVN